MAKLKNTAQNHRSKSALQDLLQVAQLHAEKCELKQAYEVYVEALERAKQDGDLKATMEVIAGLLRLSGEALDERSIERWDLELNQLMKAYPNQIPPMAWYCKGALARHRNQIMLAQRFFHRYLKAVRAEGSSDVAIAKGWLMLTTLLQQRGHVVRSLWLANEILKYYGPQNLRGINGTLYVLLGLIFEKKREYKVAIRWYQKAHAQFLSEHNWYYHLYVLYGYARVARHSQNYSQAYWYLDLVSKAIAAPEFGLLRREISVELACLEQDAVDLLIDSRRGLVQTRESGQVSLRKQYVLLHILEALSDAHRRSGKDLERGLSKAEIIEYVWKESYRPEAHDNKLYYNINRLRKLIEPNVRKPQYLLNWKEGYRLAPGLRIHYVGDLGMKREGER